MDLAIFSYINGFSGQSPILDAAVQGIAGNTLFKGLPLMMLFWWLWFARPERRSMMTGGVIAAVFAAAITKALSIVLPFRLRPVHDPEAQAIIPWGRDIEILQGWSSFPSDHAALFFALSFAIWRTHRAVGTMVLVYFFLVICVARIFIAAHWPSDILGGVVVAGITVLLLQRAFARLVEPFIDGDSMMPPHYLYPAMFLLTFLVADNLNPLDQIARGVLKVLGGAV